VEYVAATLHRLMKEAEAEGIRRLFLISVRARRPLRAATQLCWTNGTKPIEIAS